MSCVSVEGDIQQLKNGLKLIDEKGNMFDIETVAMSDYHNIEDYKKHAELVLIGDIENMGKNVFFSVWKWMASWMCNEYKAKSF